eukprot:1158272-Pelagomonas_calceolata.AAC.4
MAKCAGAGRRRRGRLSMCVRAQACLKVEIPCICALQQCISGVALVFTAQACGREGRCMTA